MARPKKPVKRFAEDLREPFRLMGVYRYLVAFSLMGDYATFLQAGYSAGADDIAPTYQPLLCVAPRPRMNWRKRMGRIYEVRPFSFVERQLENNQDYSS